MNQLTEALQSLMNQNQGSVLDVPHPADFANVQIKELTAWHDSALKNDWHREEDGDWNKTVVKGRLAEVTNLDAYGEPLGAPQIILQHKYGHPTRQSKDVSTTNVQPHEVRKMKERFPTAFQEYEMKLARERAEIPLVLLDNVPPDVIAMIGTMGVRTVREFAVFDDAKVEELLKRLHAHQMVQRAGYVPEYLARAREMIGHVPPDAVEAPARPKRQAA
jgi:hypothetical protein